MTKTQIVSEIAAHIDRSGTGYGKWYAGITGSIEQRLFGEHNVSRQNSWHIWRTAATSQEARDAEAELFSLGCQGGPGGGDDDCRIVYAYLITATTKE